MSAIDPNVLTGSNIDLDAARQQLEIAKAEIEAFEALFAGLATVASTGDYGDLLNVPAAPALHAVALSGEYADLENPPALAPVALSGDYGDLTGTPGLHAVALSGLYSALDGAPVLGSAAALDAGIGAEEVLQLDAAGRIPAVDGSQLTGLPAGALVNWKHHTYGSWVNTAATFPYDNTIPQIGEGAPLTSTTYSAASAANILLVTAIVPFSVPATLSGCFALFKDAVADSFAHRWVTGDNNWAALAVVRGQVVAGTTDPVTIALRYGPNSSTLYVNGDTSGAKGGGGHFTSLLIEERLPES